MWAHERQRTRPRCPNLGVSRSDPIMHAGGTGAANSAARGGVTADPAVSGSGAAPADANCYNIICLEGGTAGELLRDWVHVACPVTAVHLSDTQWEACPTCKTRWTASSSSSGAVRIAGWCDRERLCASIDLMEALISMHNDCSRRW